MMKNMTKIIIIIPLVLIAAAVIIGFNSAGDGTQEITTQVSLKNTGYTDHTYMVVSRIEGIAEKRKNITIDADETRIVAFIHTIPLNICKRLQHRYTNHRSGHK